MTDQVIYSMVRVGKLHPPSKQVLRDISLGFYYGAKIGVLGLNGAGKSTLLKIMAGVDEEYLGETMLTKGYTRGLLEQEPQLDNAKTVKEVVEEAVQPIVDAMKQYDDINAKFAEPDADFDALIEEQGRLQEYLDKHDAWTLDSRLNLAMDALRCPPGDASIAVLSGGERRRVALCRLLLTEPDILLLDEPTNHLDAESVQWLEKHLQQYAGTVIAVTHDRYFLDNVAGWILELDRGYGIPWKGNYTSWLEQKQQRLALEEKADTRRQKTLERELEWIHMSQKARQAKGKARVNAYERLLSQEHDKYRDELEIMIPNGQRLGEVVIEAKGVSKAYGDHVLFENLDFALPPGGIVGVIGPNGAGKTTLLKMIMKTETPDSGTFKIGETVQARLRGSEPRHTEFRKRRVAGNLRRRRHADAGQSQNELTRLRSEFQLPGHGSVEEGGRAVRRRAQSRASGEDAERRRERDPARRTDQRFGREHAAGDGRSAGRIRGLRRRRQPRSLVSRSRGDTHPRLRGRQPGDVVRRQFLGLRGEQTQAIGPGGGSAASHQV